MKEEQMKTRILFVDDEPRVLSGLQRMLRKMRHQWDMDFAPSGYKALDILEQKKFDVVVSDMRMPGMDGSQFLAKVKDEYPLIVRIALSGQSDMEMIMKSVRPAHRYLTKPCDPELLLITIGRSCALHELLNQESLKRVVSQTEFIPSLPALYTEVMNELKSQDCSIKRVGNIISKDLGMTSKILQLVNSAFFGIPRHVSDPGQAVHLLGLDTVRTLVLTVGVFSKFDNATLSTLNIENIYKHCMMTATIAKTIAHKENIDSEMVDNTFMAGMLHDLGKLVLSANFPELYREVFELSSRENIPFHQAEVEKIGVTHAEVGAYLLGLWGLPESIVESVAFHHNPGKCPSNDINPLTAVYVANIMENRSNASHDEDIMKDFDSDYLKELNIIEKIPVWNLTLQQMDFRGKVNE